MDTPFELQYKTYSQRRTRPMRWCFSWTHDFEKMGANNISRPMTLSLDIAKLTANLIIKKAKHEKDQPEPSRPPSTWVVAGLGNPAWRQVLRRARHDHINPIQYTLSHSASYSCVSSSTTTISEDYIPRKWRHIYFHKYYPRACCSFVIAKPFPRYRTPARGLRLIHSA